MDCKCIRWYSFNTQGGIRLQSVFKIPHYRFITPGDRIQPVIYKGFPLAAGSRYF
ncbi:hypothetical protein SAMN04488505_10540 [Chitinophaga rupis]|uniref:Uncharacterized protein n=1 Tax=Chitinophaga rupis TaxID=573321 RepID=A0A1H7ZCQ4_9BACT|nr:hypothetical protein SAMN04488505_10540 [Chitinophaga rupis]